jgi:F-type H+-transporting ATPase subunit b
MPQLDFTTYSSQIFWFILCFSILYLSTHFIILPRLRSILSKRHDLIENDKNLAEEINLQIDLINNEGQENLQKANHEYLQKIEEITKKSHQERDKSMAELKHKIELKVKESRDEIKKFVDDSKASNTKIIQDLVQIIKNKIIN